MRTIKFRGFNKDSGKMWEIKRIDFGDAGITMDGYGDLFPLMQFTGFKDRLGKEIYSDDYLEDVAGSILCVFWGSGKYILQNISSGDIIDCNEANTQNKEIIGNRYENPREHKAMASDL